MKKRIFTILVMLSLLCNFMTFIYARENEDVVNLIDNSNTELNNSEKNEIYDIEDDTQIVEDIVQNSFVNKNSYRIQLFALESPTFSGGLGTETDPYILSTFEDIKE